MIANSCDMTKRLEITYNKKYDKIFLSRCCYTCPFTSIDLKDINNIDIFLLAKDSSFSHKRIPGSEASCPLDQQNICNKILPDIKTVTVGISHACNLSCYHCFFEDHKDSPDQKNLYFQLLEKIKGHNLDMIHMQSSGEVFFYYYKIKEYLKSLTVNDTKEVNFQTNGLLLSKDRLKELKKISDDTGITYTFSFSVDAITEETYKKVRGGDFEKLLTNISDTIEEFSRENIAFTFTIKEPNKHEAAEFEKFIMNKFNYSSCPTYLSFDYFDKSCQDLFLEIKTFNKC